LLRALAVRHRLLMRSFMARPLIHWCIAQMPAMIGDRWKMYKSAIVIILALLLPPAGASDDANQEPAANRTSQSGFDVPDRPRPALLNGTPARTIDGSNNNPEHPEWGKSGDLLRRVAPAAYADDIAAPAGPLRPNPRALSNAILAQPELREERMGMSDIFWLWGQFIDHDISLTEVGEHLEPFPLSIPQGDPWFDPDGTGTREMAFERSAWDPATGTDPDNPRQQTNIITTWIDASQVYGSDPVRAAALRRNDGSGKLKTSAGELLPFNTAGLPNAGGTSPDLFLAGDVRANENLLLTAMHTVWLREHNRIADEIAAANPGLSGDSVYEEARARVGAMLQVITYKEFLPSLLGHGALAPYSGYDDDLDPAVANAFSTAAFRLGHSMVAPVLRRLDPDLKPITEGPLPLRHAFFSPEQLQRPRAVAELMRGAAIGTMQHLDRHIVDDLRNFLFGPPGSGGFDLGALNIQRGRDHGLPDYNTIRVAYGLPPVASFAEITGDPELQAVLRHIYSGVDNIDPWIGALAEDRLNGAMIGPLLRTALTEQFSRLRDADRFWYQRVFSGETLAAIEATRLSDVVRRNTAAGAELPLNLFRGEQPASQIPTLGLPGLITLAVLMLILMVAGHRCAPPARD